MNSKKIICLFLVCLFSAYASAQFHFEKQSGPVRLYRVFGFGTESSGIEIRFENTLQARAFSVFFKNPELDVIGNGIFMYADSEQLTKIFNALRGIDSAVPMPQFLSGAEGDRIL